jgi:hypothetical protein
MLGCLRRRGARNKPKRLRVLHFRTVGPWTYRALLRWSSRHSPRKLDGCDPRQIRFGPYVRGALLSGTVSGQPEAERRANARDHRPREGHVNSRRARRRSRGSCPYASVSLQNSTGGSTQRSHPLRNAAVRKVRRECVVNGGLAFGCTNRAELRPPSPAAPSEQEAFCCEAMRGKRSRG